MTLPVDILAALEELKTGKANTPRSMPPGFYTATSVHEAEIEPVFLNGWICVGRSDELPQIGDYYTVELFDEPLIVVRKTEAQIEVLSNVCRHRGSKLLNGRGNSKRITCPYHRWSYSLDGSLRNAPIVDKTEHFDPKRCALPRFNTVEWLGWIFVNLNANADSFDDLTDGVKQYVKNYHPEEMRTVAIETEHWEANWKCLAENFMEGYHLTPVHKNTLHPMTPTQRCEKIPGDLGYTGYRAHYSPSFPGRTPYHPDTTPSERSQSMMVWIYPSFVAAVSPNSAVYMSITPTGPESLQTRWGTIAREELFQSEEAEQRMEFARSFNNEDRERLLDLQKGLRSRFATAGYLAPPDFEGTIWDFYHYMADKLI